MLLYTSYMNFLRSLGAVTGGFVVVVMLSVGTDSVLERMHIFPSSDDGLFITWMLVLAFVYRSLYTVLGGYVTAYLAPFAPMRHVFVLAVIGTLGGIAGVFAGWDLSPHWYPIVLAVTAFPLVWWGGYMGTPKSDT